MLARLCRWYLRRRVPGVCAPMGRENKGDDFVIGYMDKTDFEYELGLACGGNHVYPSVADIKENKACIDSCGIVEVEIRARRLVEAGADP